MPHEIQSGSSREPHASRHRFLWQPSATTAHMPTTTYGLLKGIRSHQISSQTWQLTQKTGRPNACERLSFWTSRLAGPPIISRNWYGQSPQLFQRQGKKRDPLRFCTRSKATPGSVHLPLMRWVGGRHKRRPEAIWLAPYLTQFARRSLFGGALYRVIGRCEHSLHLRISSSISPNRRRKEVRSFPKSWAGGKQTDLEANEATLIKAPGQIDQNHFQRTRRTSR
jgi:hypothetical protein